MDNFRHAAGGEDVAQDGRQQWVAPEIRALSEDEVLAAFQLTAAKISAAGCWWGSS
jgi:DNA-binding SARP family transcriptional activator